MKTILVTEVIAGIDETELIEGLDTETWYGNFRGQTCKRTSYNHNIRKQYAGIGYTYDAINDVFIAPQPYPSWSLDDNFDWQAPTPMPNDGEFVWDEDSTKLDGSKWLDYAQQVFSYGSKSMTIILIGIVSLMAGLLMLVTSLKALLTIYQEMESLEL
jgi:hypothetical protein